MEKKGGNFKRGEMGRGGKEKLGNYKFDQSEIEAEETRSNLRASREERWINKDDSVCCSILPGVGVVPAKPGAATRDPLWFLPPACMCMCVRIPTPCRRGKKDRRG